MRRHPVIGVLVETSTSWGRNIIRGVSRYAQEHTDWGFRLQPWGVYDSLRLQVPQEWAVDGLIARITREDLLEDIRRIGCPTVNVSTTRTDRPENRIVSCTVDETAIGRMAAEHFLELGFHAFAHCGAPTNRDHYQNRQWDGFSGRLRESGYEALLEDIAPSLAEHSQWASSQKRLAEWLMKQDKPLGILAWNAHLARLVAEACRQIDIHIPEEVAIISGDYDDVFCSTASPPISSVDPPSRQVGYNAARMLHEMLEGHTPASPFLMAPLGITVRQSTDSVAVNDPELAMALAFIRKHATERINVNTVLKQVPIGRRSLELQCLKILGRSPAAEIRRIRIQKAARLLEETELSIHQIARKSGFENPNILLRNFRRSHGMSPSVYRRKMGQGGTTSTNIDPVP